MRTSLRAALLAAAAFLAACATSSSQQQGASAAPGETPEIPYASQPAPAQQQAEVVKTQPAPDSQVQAAPAPLPVAPPPQATQDSAARAAFARALDAAHRGDSLTAERELRAVLDRDDKLDYAWTNLGVVYERQGEFGQAEKAYRRALELKPDQEAAWDFLTRLACRQGRATQTEGDLRTRIQQFPSALGLRNALVFALLAQNKLESAGNEAKKVLKSDERNVRAMQLLAQVYYREQKYELAKMVLENARAVAPNEAATHNALGLVNLKLKARPTALENFKQAAQLKPDYAEAKNNFGAMLNEAQDYESAVRELQAAVNSAPDFASARLNLGNAYRGKQDFARAIAEYERVLKLKPEWADTYFNLAILHLDSEVPSMDAIQRLKQSIAYFEQYRGRGGKDDRVDQYIKDANKGIDKEERRREREKKDQLKKAEREAKEAAERAKAPPASKLGEEEVPAGKTVPAGTSGKLSGDEK